MGSAIARVDSIEVVSAASDFMPVFEIQQAVARRNAIINFTKSIMEADVDYGKIPGTEKNCLLKPGAEKLCTFFGLVPEFIIVEKVEDWTGVQHGGESLFYYQYKCRLSRNSRLLGEGEGSCSTWESKYRYRWVSEEQVLQSRSDAEVAALPKRGGRLSEFTFAIDKAETSGKYGKPAAYWQRFNDAIDSNTARKIKKPMGKEKKMSDAWEIDAWEYRVPNPDTPDLLNTCQKMAQKRALVAAVLVTTNASEFFTQDVEDMENIATPVSAPAMQQKAPIQQQPTSTDKPWHTRGEMKKVFDTVRGIYSERGTLLAYISTLEAHGAPNQDVSKFPTPEKALACYHELMERLSNTPVEEEIRPEEWPDTVGVE